MAHLKIVYKGPGLDHNHPQKPRAQTTDRNRTKEDTKSHKKNDRPKSQEKIDQNRTKTIIK